MDFSVRNPDHLAERLLGDPSTLGLDHPVVDAMRASYDEAMGDMELAGLVRAMNVRTRFIGEALEHAVAAGLARRLRLRDANQGRGTREHQLEPDSAGGPGDV